MIHNSHLFNDQNIFRFQISMNNPNWMKIFQCSSNWIPKRERGREEMENLSWENGMEWMWKISIWFEMKYLELQSITSFQIQSILQFPISFSLIDIFLLLLRCLLHFPHCSNVLFLFSSSFPSFCSPSTEFHSFIHSFSFSQCLFFFLSLFFFLFSFSQSHNIQSNNFTSRRLHFASSITMLHWFPSMKYPRNPINGFVSSSPLDRILFILMVMDQTYT